MSDNRTFDMSCVELDVALPVAMGRHLNCTHILERDDLLVLFWADPTSQLSTPINGTISKMIGAGADIRMMQRMIATWLETAKFPAKTWDGGDVIHERSCRIYNGPNWSQVEKWGWASICAVEPCWALYGK